MSEKGYNGWKNRETWLIALYINNDECLYHAVKESKVKLKKAYEAQDLLRSIGVNSIEGLWIGDMRIHWPEIKQCINDIRSGR